MEKTKGLWQQLMDNSHQYDPERGLTIEDFEEMKKMLSSQRIPTKKYLYVTVGELKGYIKLFGEKWVAVWFGSLGNDVIVMTSDEGQNIIEKIIEKYKGDGKENL